MKLILNYLQSFARYILNSFDDERSKIYFTTISLNYESEITAKNYHNNNEYESREHLLWMLNEIRTNDMMSITKKHRWLGYVQGILCAYEVINVDDERNKTRNIFNGD